MHSNVRKLFKRLVVKNIETENDKFYFLTWWKYDIKDIEHNPELCHLQENEILFWHGEIKNVQKHFLLLEIGLVMKEIWWCPKSNNEDGKPTISWNPTNIQIKDALLHIDVNGVYSFI